MSSPKGRDRPPFGVHDDDEDYEVTQAASLEAVYAEIARMAAAAPPTPPLPVAPPPLAAALPDPPPLAAATPDPPPLASEPPPAPQPVTAVEEPATYRLMTGLFLLFAVLACGTIGLLVFRLLFGG